MAQYSSADVGFVLIDGYSVLGYSTTLNDSVEAILQENTVLGASWATFKSVGIRRGALSQSGFYDDVAGGINDALVNTKVGTSRIFTHNLETNAIGAQFVGYGGAFEAKYERVVTLEKLHVANALYNPSGAVETGQVLHALGAKTAASGDTKSTNVDNSTVRQTVVAITSNSIANPTVVTTPNPHGLVTGDVIMISGVSSSSPTINGERTATKLTDTTFTVPVNVTVGGTGGTFVRCSSPAGGAGYLQVPTLVLGGYTSVTIKIQHSVDASTWVDLVTFANVTAAPTAQRVTAAGDVRRYLCITWLFNGAGSGMSITFMAGFARS
jgi:hypothetical protein